MDAVSAHVESKDGSSNFVILESFIVDAENHGIVGPADDCSQLSSSSSYGGPAWEHIPITSAVPEHSDHWPLIFTFMKSDEFDADGESEYLQPRFPSQSKTCI